ncbi:polycystic kidney disease protein 1-like 2 [Stylophora pistillata]|nr:polycystic kidney disease protein 1-like 2 [Stylophora pistillata]
MISTKLSSRNIVFRRGKLLEGSSYRLTLTVQLPNGKYGWAAYQFKTVAAPSGGTCSGTQASGKPLGISLYINCTGWNDKNKHLTYEFFHQVEDGNSHLLLYSTAPFANVLIPKFDGGEVDIKVVVINSFAMRTETSIRIQVTSTSGTNFTGAEASFNRYLREGALYDAWQVALVLTQAVITNVDAHWIKSYEKQISDHIFQELSNSNATDIQTVLLLLSVLNLSTSNPKYLSSATMQTGLVILEKWVELIDSRVHRGNGKDRALDKDAWPLALHCSGNILHATIRRVSSSTKERKKLQKIQRKALDLKESMVHSVMSSKLTGEEYSVMKTKHNTLILGKHEIHEMSDLRVEDDKASFLFPEMSEAMTKKLFGKAKDVQFQMITYAANPYSIQQPANEISSEVLSLTLKDDNGNVINISDLASEIALKVPISEKIGNETPSVDEYSVPDFMLYRDFTEIHGNSKIKLSLNLQKSALFEMYVKYGARPSKEDFDFFTTLDKKTCRDKTNICGNVSHHVWFDAERKGKYFIGLLQKEISTRKRRSTAAVDSLKESLQVSQIPKKRIARSNSELTRSNQELCVKFKNPPEDETTMNETIDLPPYDPEKSVNFTVVVDSVGCRYWSESNQQWLSDGCKAGINSTSTALQCLCNHLTSFGGYFVVTPNRLDFDKVLRFRSDDQKDYIVIMAVSVVFLVYFIVLIPARKADKRDLEKVGPLVPLQSPVGSHRYKLSITTGTWRNSGTSANVSIKIYGTESSSGIIKLSCKDEESRKPFERGNTDNFLIAIDRPIGALIKVFIGHDSFGEEPSWFLNEISVTDLQLNCSWTVPCFRWLGLELEDGKTTLELYAETAKRCYDFKTQFNNVNNYMFANEHMWFSIATKDPKDVFTRVERVTCCCFFLLWGMLVSAIFYQGDVDKTRPIQVGPFKMTIQELSVSVVTAVIAFVPSYFVVFLFRMSRRPRVADDEDFYRDSDNGTNRSFKLPHLGIYIAWSFCVAGSVLSSVFIIFFSLLWRGDKSSRWLASVFLTSTEDIFFSQPLKIVVISVILSLLFARKRIQTREIINSAELSKSDDKSELFSMTEKEIEEQRKFRTTERKTNLFARNIVFSSVFLVLLLIVCYGDRSDERFHLTEATRNAFTNLSQVKNTSRLWKWLDDVLIPVVYAGEWYNGQKEPRTVYAGNKRSIVVGMPRLRQLRIQKDSCAVPGVLGNWVSSCYDFYSKEKEDKKGWDMISNKTSILWMSVVCPENWKYMTEDDVGDYSSYGVHSTYGGGGYVANLGYLDYTARRILQDLAKNEWIDRQTRVVLIEFTMFSVATNQLVDLVLYFEMIPSGFLGSFLRIEVIPMTKSDSASTIAYLTIKLLFAFFLGYYTVTECVRAYRLKCANLKSIWRWLEMLQILSALSVVIISIEKEKRITQALENLSKNPYAIVSFHDAIFWFQIENHMICIAVTIATLRFLRLLKFNRQIIILFLSMKKSVKPILSYAVVFFIVFTAFAHAGSLLFGQSVYLFSSFFRVIVLQFRIAVGASAPRRELEGVHSRLAKLYMESFLFFTVVLLINFFVAILNDVHAESTSADKDNEDMEVARRLVFKFLKMFGITKNQPKVSPKTKKEEENVKENRHPREGSISKPNSSANQAEKTETSKEMDVNLTDFDRTNSKPLRQRRRSIPTTGAFPVSKNSSQESIKKKQEFVSSPKRKARVSTNVQIREVSAPSNDFIGPSMYSRSLSNKKRREKGSTSEATVNSSKRVSVDAPDENHGTLIHSYDASQEVYEKSKDKISDFDDISKWLKRIDSSSNASMTISEFPIKMSNNPKSDGGTVDFDRLSRILKLREKARKLRETAGERKTKELIRQAKQLDRLLYLLDQSESI